MSARKKFGENVGDKGFDVEWVHLVPVKPDGELDWDEAVPGWRDIEDQEVALAFARQVAAISPNRQVTVAEFEIHDGATDANPDGIMRIYGATREYRLDESGVLV